MWGTRKLSCGVLNTCYEAYPPNLSPEFCTLVHLSFYEFLEKNENWKAVVLPDFSILQKSHHIFQRIEKCTLERGMISLWEMEGVASSITCNAPDHYWCFTNVVKFSIKLRILSTIWAFIGICKLERKEKKWSYSSSTTKFIKHVTQSIRTHTLLTFANTACQWLSSVLGRHFTPWWMRFPLMSYRRMSAQIGLKIWKLTFISPTPKNFHK